MVFGGDQDALAAGDVVSARGELPVDGGLVIPAGRHGVVESVGDGDERITVRVPLVIQRKRRLRSLVVPRSALWLECRSDDVLREDPANRVVPEDGGEWAVLQKDELVSLGARLKQVTEVPAPHVFAGLLVPRGIFGTIVACTEVPGVRVTYEVNVTLPDPGSYQGYRFTNLNLARHEFELVDPARAHGIQRVELTPGDRR